MFGVEHYTSAQKREKGTEGKKSWISSIAQKNAPGSLGQVDGIIGQQTEKDTGEYWWKEICKCSASFRLSFLTVLQSFRYQCFSGSLEKNI